MAFDPTKLEDRMRMLNHVRNNGEKGRKNESFKQWEVYQDRIRDYVVNDLREQFDTDSIKEIPIQSSINLSKRIVDQCAIIYKHEPDREYVNLSEEQSEMMKDIYDDMRVNKKLSASNKGYELQDQSHLWVVPKDGRLILRVLKNHQISAIPDERDPEAAAAYIVSAFNKDDFLQQDHNNLDTATGYKGKVDQHETSKKFKERMEEEQHNAKKSYICWTKEWNWSMDNRGNLTSDINPNPLAEYDIMPFIDISLEKEFEYWVRQGTGVSDFTIEFNTRLSEVAQVVKMQGFAQAVLKGPEELLANNIKVGPTYLLKILTDPARGIDGDFSFANPNSDIQGSINWIESLLSLFLSSRGIDPKTITAKGESTTYNSGLERLLAMIEKISANAESFDVYKKSEQKLYRLILAWIEILQDTDGLLPEYKIGSIPKDTYVTVKYDTPDLIQSEADRLTNAERRIELGMSSSIREIMDKEDVDREEAEKLFAQYQADERLKFGERPETEDNIRDGRDETNG